MDKSIFEKLAKLVEGTNSRTAKEHEDFLKTYRGIVEMVPLSVANEFGNMDGINIVSPKQKIENCRIELTATDYLWWKTRFANGWRVQGGTQKLLRKMATHLAKSAEGTGLDIAERKALLEIIDGIE